LKEETPPGGPPNIFTESIEMPVAKPEIVVAESVSESTGP
jgi:hypothetical protein